MKTKRIISGWRMAYFLICVSALTGASVMAEDTASASVWGVDGSGATSLTVTPDGSGAVTVAFPEQATGSSAPIPLVCDLLIGGSDPSNLFTGDLKARGFSGARFRINGDGSVPASVKLVIFQRLSRTIRQWEHNGVSVSSTLGEWRITQIPLDVHKGWNTGYSSSLYTKEEMWDIDLADVQTLLLRIVPSGMNAQTYSISDFQLVGPGVISEPAILSPLQAYFGINSISELTAEMRALDSDGDGMSDYNELLAGLNPYDASSVLSANVSVAASANTVTWDGVLGGTYGVMRSNNLLEGFNLIASGLKATFTGQMLSFSDTAPVSGKPNYYKVVKY